MRLSIVWVAAAIVGCAGSEKPSLINQGALSLDKTQTDFKESQQSWGSSARLTLENTDFQSPRRLEQDVAKKNVQASTSDEDLLLLAKRHLSQNFPSTSLRFVNIRRGERFAYLTFQQTQEDIEILNARIVVRMGGDGEWLTMSSTLVNPELLTNLSLEKTPVPSIAHLMSEPYQVIATQPVIYPRKEESEMKFYLAHQITAFTLDTQQEIWLWIDQATQKPLGAYNPATALDTVQIKADVVSNAPGDSLLEVFLPRVTALFENSKLIADEKGQFDRQALLKPGARIVLENEYVSVISNATKTRDFVVDPGQIPGDASALKVNGTPSLEEINVFYWLMQARKFLSEELNYKGMTYQLAAYTHYGNDYDNAFFMPATKTLSFGAGGKFLKNTALSRDVIIHEFGHAVTQDIYGTITTFEFNSMNEAFSDYFAATITNDPLIAEGAMQERTGRKYLRTVENTFTFPKDFTGRAFHDDGQMFSGALWDLRKALGPKKADAMIHEARLAQAKSIREFLKELLAIDEDSDDRNPFTASKNERVIWKAFKNHGLNSAASFEKAPEEDLTISWKRGCWGVSEGL